MNTLGIAVLSFFVIGYGLVSSRMQKTIVSAPMVFVAFGLLLGDAGFGLLALDLESPFIHILAEVTLITVLFTDASRIDLKLLRSEHAIPQRLLLIGLPLCILLGAIVASLVFDTLTIWEGLVLAAILAPTDAALGQAVVSSKLVPVRIRQALNVESGLNDGIALPVVLIAISLISPSHGEQASYWVTFTAKQVILGPLMGVAIGYFGGKLIGLAQNKDSMTHAFRDLAVLSLGLAAFAFAELLHGNGFISSFCAGLTIGNTLRDHCDCLYEFAESEGQLLTLFIFMIFGAVMVLPAFEQVHQSTVFYAILSLTVVRMIPTSIALTGMKLRVATQIFLGWFGPRGIASILFALLVLEDASINARDEIFSIVVFTVLFSVIAHGMSAVPGTSWYAERVSGEARADMPEHEHAPEMPTRLGWTGETESLNKE